MYNDVAPYKTHKQSIEKLLKMYASLQSKRLTSHIVEAYSTKIEMGFFHLKATMFS